jgi:hypothetical protein
MIKPITGRNVTPNTMKKSPGRRIANPTTKLDSFSPALDLVFIGLSPSGTQLGVRLTLVSDPLHSNRRTNTIKSRKGINITF